MTNMNKDISAEELIIGQESQLFYISKDSQEQVSIDRKGGKFECPFCKLYVKNLLIHFNRNMTCQQNVNMEEFQLSFENYKRGHDKLLKKMLNNAGKKEILNDTKKLNGTMQTAIEKKERYMMNRNRKKKTE